VKQNNNQRDATALRALLDGNVYVLGDMDDGGSNIRIQNGRAHYGTPATPFFSSVDILQQSVDSSQTYLAMPAKTLFELLPSTHFVLNPRSEDRREFSPAFIRQLLNGSYFAAAQTASNASPQVAQTMAAKLRSILSLRKN
jgi:SseB protein N-terminal domain